MNEAVFRGGAESAQCDREAGAVDARTDLLVLVVEDDPQLRLALIGWLTQRHFRVISAGDCGSGIREALAWRPNAILLDLRLPDGSGLNLLSELNNRGLSIPFVVLTGNAGPREGFEAGRYGAGQVIEKPATPDGIATAIMEVATGSQGSDVLYRLGQQIEGRSFEEAIADIALAMADLRLGLLEFSMFADLFGRSVRTRQHPGAALEQSRRLLAATRLRAGEAILNLIEAINSTDRAQQSELVRVLRRSRRRQVHETTGRRLSSWVRLSRLRVAIQELVHTDEHVDQIAQALRFSRGGQLGRDVNLLLGVSPRLLRQLTRARRF